MQFKTILNEIEPVAEIREVLGQGKTAFITGCVPSEREHLIFGLGESFDVRVIIAEEESRAQEILGNYLPFDRDVLYYPAVDPVFYKADIQGSYISEQRVEVIRNLYDGKNFTIITTPEVFEERLSSLKKMAVDIIKIKPGDTVIEEELSEKLVNAGYSHESQVGAHGEFSIRGNIIDVFPYSEDAPYRIDLFGDEVESIKYFDVESQRSISDVEEITIFPAGTEVHDYGEMFGTEEIKESDDAGRAFLMEYFTGRNTLFVVDEPEKTLAGHEGLCRDLNGKSCLLMSLFNTDSRLVRPDKKILINTKNIPSYNGRFTELIDDLKKYKKAGYRVLVFAATSSRAENMVKNFLDMGITAFAGTVEETEIMPGQIMVTTGALRVGFEYPDIKFSVISEVDIFGRNKIKKRKRKLYSGDPLRDFSDLNIGDYVVHENHGVGIYRGIERMTVDGCEKDYMKIEYAKNDCLFVLATDFDRIQKYAGADSAKPKINRIGGKEWINTKERVRNAVKDIAKELVELYAIRQTKQGHRYGEDTVWQREFEDQFEFDETEDQLRAIEEIKTDMESGKIMDRLLCGDVGFGKTEVAIRAAFKAVQEGKQVALLVPTTVLAQQHFNTLTKRMEHYPVTIKMLSRFVAAGEQKEIIKELKKGMVDIVIGTHRLLSEDIEFKDLGLLIIDEEQRFGASHKEKIKKMRKDVDVLALSATPIPRTLQMSLAGIRDMSLLTEPPVDRVPIQTYVMEYSEEAVREAIVREIGRGGQVYYVYNRVDNIEIIANRIQELVPNVNVQCAHGQMRPRDLEQIMYDFMEGVIDVLVSTTIVETGLDISNVNTIIIHDADNFGLSQLYQLRGRVGRSHRTAYAFLMYRRDKLIREVAEKRLKAIREFSDLGSGIKIAMKDLEIRGAGNLLGAEQSGHMEAVGYELYCKMVNHAIMMLKGEEIPEDFDTTIDLNIDGYIPSEYIKNEYEKLSMYKKIAAIDSIESLEDIQEELLDRFGPVPRVVGNLLTVALIRAKAHKLYVAEISGSKDQFKIIMYRNAKIDGTKMPEFMERHRDNLKFVAELRPYFLYSPKRIPTSVKAVQDVLLEFFAMMNEIVEK